MQGLLQKPCALFGTAKAFFRKTKKFAVFLNVPLTFFKIWCIIFVREYFSRLKFINICPQGNREYRMGAYYKIFSSLAVLIFVVMFVIVAISTVVGGKRMRNEAERIERETVVVRYFMDDEDTSRVAFLRVKKGEYYTLGESPVDNGGGTFLGLYDAQGNPIVDQYGRSLQPAGSNMLLYPRFQSTVGE